MNFRPSALIIDYPNSISTEEKEKIEDTVYKQQFTTAFHIILAIALACFAWIFMIKPLFKEINIPENLKEFENIKYLPFLFWLFIFPIVILSTNTLNDSIMSKGSQIFIYLKFITIWLTSIAVIFCIYYNDNKIVKKFISNYFGKDIKANLVKILMVGLTVINIGEAVLDQFGAFKGLEIDPKPNDISDYINAIAGLVILFLFVHAGNKSKFDVTNGSSMNILNYNIPLSLILAYTFWNLHFRSYLLRNTSTFLFLVVSLILPIISNYIFPNSWFQVRVLTLFFYIMIVLGLDKNDSRFFPFYNEQGYIEKPDSENGLSKIQTTGWYKGILVNLTIICLLIYIFGSK